MSSPTGAQSRLDDLLPRYEADTHAFRPDEARLLGFREFDGLLPELGAGALGARIEFLEDMLEDVGAGPNGLDARLFAHALRSELWSLKVERRQNADPMHAAQMMDPSVYIKRDYAPWKRRRESLLRHLNAVPDFLDAADSQLDPELSRPCLETAVEVFEGLLTFLRRDMGPSASTQGELGGGFEASVELAAGAVEKHLRVLREDYLPRASEEFALGSSGYQGMLSEGEGVDVSIDELIAHGQNDLQRNAEALTELCARVDPAATPRQIVDDIARAYPEPVELLETARRTVMELQEFFDDRPIVGVPASEPAVVEESPPFQRWAFASLDAPGVFDVEGLPTFYYITSPEPGWAPERVADWMTVFNTAGLRVMSGHEVFPGHFLHWLHARRAPSRATRLFSSSYHFWEGWAHYTEELLIEQGYRAEDTGVAIMQRIEALHRTVRLLCSAWMHTGAMSVDEATRFFMEHAHRTEGPARNEARRGTFDPQYMGYTLGKLLLLKLREDVRAAEGDGFDLVGFHDRFLSVGAPPIPLVREEVFGLRDGRLL